MAEDRLLAGVWRSERVASMRRKSAAVLIPSACAMMERPVQNGSSRETLVAWPAIVTERLTIAAPAARLTFKAFRR